jgi:phosphoglycerate dehydrogenase-like enzyme
LTPRRVYVHRAGPWHRLFMTPENEAALASFSEVVSEGAREEPLGHEDLIRRMRGCTAILSLNGYGASDITPEVLRDVGTIQLICIAQHWGQFAGLGEPGIEVVEGSDAATAAVGEWCLAAALMGVRRLDRFDRLLKAGSACSRAARRGSSASGGSDAGSRTPSWVSA